MIELDRNNIIYFEVKYIERNNITYHVNVFGDGNYYAAYAGKHEADNDMCEHISRSEEEAVEQAILKYESSKLLN